MGTKEQGRGVTVIAYRDGIIAADTAQWCGGIICGYQNKIRRSTKGLYAAAGRVADADECWEWLCGRVERPAALEKDDFGAVWLSGGLVCRIDHRFRRYDCTHVPYIAEGAHNEFLLGALAAGASAEQAVKLAIRFGDSAGGEIQVERA